MFAAAALALCLAAPTTGGCTAAIEAALTPPTPAALEACGAGLPKSNDAATLVRWFASLPEECLR